MELKTDSYTSSRFSVGRNWIFTWNDQRAIDAMPFQLKTAGSGLEF